MSILVEVLLATADGAAWANYWAWARVEQSAPRPVLARWRYDEEAWRRYVAATVPGGGRRAAVVLALALSAALIAAVAASGGIGPGQGAALLRLAVALAVVGAGAAGLVRFPVRRDRGRLLEGNRTLTLSLVAVCDGRGCCPLHPAFPTQTRVAVVDGAAAVLRFQRGGTGRNVLEVPVPTGRLEEARAFADRFRAESPVGA